MATIKLDKNFNLNKYFKDKTNVSAILNELRSIGPATIIKNVKDTVAIGNSPVKGYKRFQEYSESYKEAIDTGKYKKIAAQKRKRPINLWLTGKMMGSLDWEATKNGFKIFFTSELADIHSNKGAGRSKVIRKLFPSGEKEEWKEIIVKPLKDFIKSLINKQLKK